MPQYDMPPLGLRPKHIADMQRLQEIKEAIARYNEAGYAAPREWFEEKGVVYASMRDAFSKHPKLGDV